MKYKTSFFNKSRRRHVPGRSPLRVPTAKCPSGSRTKLTAHVQDRNRTRLANNRTQMDTVITDIQEQKNSKDRNG